MRRGRPGSRARDSVPLRRGLPHPVADEAGNRDVLAQLGDRLLHQLLDLLLVLLVADPGLLEEADAGVEGGELALDDLLHPRLGLALDLAAEDAPLALHDLRGHVRRADV